MYHTGPATTKKHINLSYFLDTLRQFCVCKILSKTHDFMNETDPISIALKISSSRKDQSEHSFRKAPGNFTWDVIPGASGPYGVQASMCLLMSVFGDLPLLIKNVCTGFALIFDCFTRLL